MGSLKKGKGMFSKHLIYLIFLFMLCYIFGNRWSMTTCYRVSVGHLFYSPEKPIVIFFYFKSFLFQGAGVGMIGLNLRTPRVKNWLRTGLRAGVT